ncbi:leucine-rich repeat domain-containing protein [Pseudomonas sp. rhizo25]|uniref:leucine-rich repeat domain-containing protein n=1 Tax=Pseudomonas sp. rhizo25 TaxID=3059675 RepID=UPI00288F43A0|nr:leucine-rich repeat domain-containing protein [Pseudomonas sp. rhizo25]MDT3233387.1 leucine-rich repeat domain-containing protein [Pseudomonas sp. rhizo25]
MPDSAEHTSHTSPSFQPDSHYEPLKNAIPRWLGETSLRRREALGQLPPSVPPALRDASPASKGEFKRLAIAHWEAQNTVEKALAGLLSAEDFADPILTLALKTQFGLELDVRQTFLRLYIPQTIPGFPIRSGAARTWTVSLLEAALHNFEHKETQADAHEAESTFITRPDARGQFNTLPAVKRVLPISAFIQLCRDLDIGALYEMYLQEQLGLNEPVAEAVLRLKVERSQKAELQAALHWALISGDIQPGYQRLIQGLLDGVTGLRLHGQLVRYHDLKLMDADLPGIIVFAPDLEHARTATPLVAYVPGDPEHPIKQYPSSQAMQKELVRQLRDEQYQRFFSRFVPHEQRGYFFANLSQLLGQVTWHPHEAGSNQPSWRQTPTDNPRVRFVATPGGHDLWQHQYQRKLNQILNDARSTAVATASADRKARWALWDSFVNIASSILNAAALIIAPFVPFAGELMMGYMVYQLLDEVFEGVIDWAEGLGTEAAGHLLGVVEALVQLGAFAVGGEIAIAQFRKALPQNVIDFIDRFKPVKLPKGQTRYWKPDLGAYEHATSVPPGTYREPTGLYPYQRKNLLTLDGKTYAVEEDPVSSTLYLQHPSRPDAYRPRVRHNGHGAWHTELENPLQWDRKTLLQRLGHPVEGLSEADQALALNISGVDPDVLRKMHVNGEAPPALLIDTLDRLRVDREIQSLIARLASDDPAQYSRVDPQAILQLLTSYGDWPQTRCLQFIDGQGNTAWAFGDEQLPVIQIPESQLNNGDLLKAILNLLPAEEAAEAYGASVGDTRLSLEARASHLRRKLAATAEEKRAGLFESHYGTLQATHNPRAQRLIDAAPGLPAKVAQALLDRATVEELQALGSQHTPLRLRLLARSAQAEVRVCRAFEAMHFGTPTWDSERLALHSLTKLPGWLQSLRLEVRDYSVDGAVRDRIGPPEASQVRTLVRNENGRYTPYVDSDALAPASDLYSAILSALPEAQRNAIQVDSSAQLRQHLLHHPIMRDTLRDLLTADPVRKPFYDPQTMKLLGGMDGYRAQPELGGRLPTASEQLGELFPGLDEGQMQAVLEHMQTLPGGAPNQLALLRAERQVLRDTLQAWQAAIPAQMPAEQRFYETQTRRLVTDQIEQCWRRETERDEYFMNSELDGFTLRLHAPELTNLPELSTALRHVSLLSLAGGRSLEGVEGFLRGFPWLRRLELRNIPLGDLPSPIRAMHRLNSLTLSDCNITLNEQSLAHLNAMNGLNSLDLHRNPLGLIPDVEGMPDLTLLDLSDTQIERLPNGLLSRPLLKAVWLNDNRITELPQGLFSLTPDIAHGFDLSGNPLEPAALEQIKRYAQNYNESFTAQAPSAERTRAIQLYPTFLDAEADHFLFRLPGTMADIAPTLTRLEAEYAQLGTDLQQWSLDIPARHPVLDINLDEQTAAEEQLARQRFKSSLEDAWRRESEQDEENLDDQFTHSVVIETTTMGPLPQLHARFDHVTSLELIGNGLTNGVEGTLRCFPKLQTLILSRCTLGKIPDAIAQMPNLTTLSLENCEITLTPADTDVLGNAPNLEFLSLRNNRLVVTPDVSALNHLGALYLGNTQINEVPRGLFQLPELYTIDLSNNLISDIPAALLESTTPYSDECDFSGNPLSPQSLDHLRQYYVRADNDFHVAEATVDEQGVPLVVEPPPPMEE